MSKRRSIILKDTIDNELNQYIDGNEFRNRSHAIQSILKLWLRWRRERNTAEQTNIFEQRPLAKSRPKK